MGLFLFRAGFLNPHVGHSCMAYGGYALHSPSPLEPRSSRPAHPSPSGHSDLLTSDPRCMLFNSYGQHVRHFPHNRRLFLRRIARTRIRLAWIVCLSNKMVLVCVSRILPRFEISFDRKNIVPNEVQVHFTLRDTDLQTFLAPGPVPREADLSVRTVALDCGFCIVVCLHAIPLW